MKPDTRAPAAAGSSRRRPRWVPLLPLLASALALPFQGAHGQAVSIDDAAGREFAAFRAGVAVAADDAASREATVYRRESPPLPADALSREFAGFRRETSITTTDAFAREFSVYRDRPPENPIDAVAREFIGFCRETPITTADAFVREFSVYNDTLHAAAVDACSRELALYRPERGTELADAHSREWKVWCLTPADAPAAEEIPAQFTLKPPRPNPFDRTCRLVFGLPQPTTVTLVIYDPAGRRVAQVLSGATLPAGWHTATIDGSRWRPGVYFYRFQTADSIRRTGKIVLGK